MLQYLPMILSGLQLAGQLSALKNAATSPAQTAAEQAALQGMVNADRLATSYLNPNDVITRNLQDAEMKGLTSETQRGLTDLLNADRRAQLLGRRSYFNPERRDESISQYLTRSGDRNTESARVNTLNRIMSAIQANRGNASGFSGLINAQRNSMANQQSRTPNVLAGAADILGQFKGNSSPWMNPDLASNTSNIYSALGSTR